MTERTAGDVTRLIAEWRRGDPAALERLLPLVYDELRAAARRQLRREAGDITLSATALVHEVYVRLLDQRQVSIADRAGFLGVSATVMRRVLVDHARSRLRMKRGGGAVHVDLDHAGEIPWLSDVEADEVVALDAALEQLHDADPRAARIVECRFFAGLTLEETADVLGVSSKTVQRSWITARAWLRQAIGQRGSTGLP